MRGSRGTAIVAACVMLGLGACALPGTAWSASHPLRQQRQVTTSVTGSLLITWSGDPAHGCAAAGLCGVSGTLEVHFDGNQDTSSGGPPQLNASDGSAVARVLTTEPDGSVTTCADVVPIAFSLAVHRTTRGLRAAMSSLGATPSSGRCAGPTAGDLAVPLPARRDAHGYDLSGQTPLIPGPLAVTVISKAQANIRFGTPSGFGGFGGSTSSSSGTGNPVKTRSALEETAAVTYRVSGFAGALTTDFAGLAPPLCDALGACGTSGRLVQSFAARGELTFIGQRVVKRLVDRSRALQDLRRGRMQLGDTFAGQTVHVTVAETNSPTAGTPCRATASVVLSGGQAGQPRHGADRLVLSDPLDDFGGGPADPFRTRCPGPSAQDILGANGGAIASATVTARQLGAKRLSIAFHGHGTFVGSAYAGRRSGALVLTLTLVRSTGGIRHVVLFPGEPLLP